MLYAYLYIYSGHNCSVKTFGALLAASRSTFRKGTRIIKAYSEVCKNAIVTYRPANNPLSNVFYEDILRNI